MYLLEYILDTKGNLLGIQLIDTLYCTYQIVVYSSPAFISKAENRSLKFYFMCTTVYRDIFKSTSAATSYLAIYLQFFVN